MLLFGLDRYETVAVDVCELDSVFAKIANVTEDAEGMFGVNRHIVDWFARSPWFECSEIENEYILVISHDTTRLYTVTNYFECVAKATSRSLATFFVVLSTVNKKKVRFTRIS